MKVQQEEEKRVQRLQVYDQKHGQAYERIHGLLLRWIIGYLEEFFVLVFAIAPFCIFIYISSHRTTNRNTIIKICCIIASFHEQLLVLLWCGMAVALFLGSWHGLVSEPSFRIRLSDLIDVTSPTQLAYRPCCHRETLGAPGRQRHRSCETTRRAWRHSWSTRQGNDFAFRPAQVQWRTPKNKRWRKKKSLFTKN